MGFHTKLFVAALLLLIAAAYGSRFDEDVSSDDLGARHPSTDDAADEPRSDSSEPTNEFEPDNKDVHKSFERVASLYSRTKGILKNLKHTVKRELSQTVDDLSEQLEKMVHKKVSFYKPLQAMLRANSRSLLRRMLKKIYRKRKSL